MVQARPDHLDTAAAQSRQGWIDSLRLTAGISMLGLHASADSHGLPFPAADTVDRFWPLILRAVFYCARTELFVIISIFLLMLSLQKRPRGYSDTLREQARRLLVPFLFWTVFYSLYSLIKAWHLGYLADALNRLTLPQVWLSHLVLGTGKYHLHFIPTLFGLLLFFPIFSIAITRPWMGVAAIVGLIFKWHAERWAYPAFWGTDALPYVIRCIKVFSYIGYGIAAAALAGIWLRNGTRIKRNFPKRTAYCLLITALVLLAIKLNSMLAVIETGKWIFHDRAGYWADFLMPLVLMGFCMSAAGLKWPARLTKWAPYSLGIYLCHPIFLDLAEISLPNGLTPLGQVCFKLAIAAPLTITLVAVLKHHPLWAWTVGLGPLPTSAQRNPVHSN